MNCTSQVQALARAHQLLAEAAQLWEAPERAERKLLEARSIAPRSEDVWIGLYRYYFYRGRLADAAAVAQQCLADAAAGLGLAADWRQLDAGGEDFGDMDRPDRRFYLFALKAYGYLKLRLGEFDEGEAALAVVRRLDPHDRVGSGVLQQVMARAGAPEEDD